MLTPTSGHWYLTELLMPALLRGKETSPDQHARVITTSSIICYLTTVKWNSLKDGPARRKLWRATLYAQSKFVRRIFRIPNFKEMHTLTSYYRQIFKWRGKLQDDMATKGSSRSRSTLVCRSPLIQTMKALSVNANVMVFIEGNIKTDLYRNSRNHIFKVAYFFLVSLLFASYPLGLLMRNRTGHFDITATQIRSSHSALCRNYARCTAIQWQGKRLRNSRNAVHVLNTLHCAVFGSVGTFREGQRGSI